MGLKLKALGFRVLVKPDKIESERLSDGGIIIPELNKRLAESGQEYGTVVELGPTAYKAYDDGVPWVQVGDRVVYSKYGGRWITLPNHNEVILVIDDSDILAKIEEEE